MPLVIGNSIAFEALGVGLGTVAYVAFIARATNPRFTATQFALFTSLIKVPFTDAGIALVETAVRGVLQEGVAVGLLSPDPAPAVTVPKAADVSAEDKAARLLPDVKFTATLGSDPDAAVYYLAAMLEGGEDPRFLARRIVIAASEDVGNADPQALVVAVAAAQAVEHVLDPVVGRAGVRLGFEAGEVGVEPVARRRVHVGLGVVPLLAVRERRGRPGGHLRLDRRRRPSRRGARSRPPRPPPAARRSAGATRLRACAGR